MYVGAVVVVVVGQQRSQNVNKHSETRIQHWIGSSGVRLAGVGTVTTIEDLDDSATMMVSGFTGFLACLRTNYMYKTSFAI